MKNPIKFENGLYVEMTNKELEIINEQNRIIEEMQKQQEINTIMD